MAWRKKGIGLLSFPFGPLTRDRRHDRRGDASPNADLLTAKLAHTAGYTRLSRGDRPWLPANHPIQLDQDLRGWITTFHI